MIPKPYTWYWVVKVLESFSPIFSVSGCRGWWTIHFFFGVSPLLRALSDTQCYHIYSYDALIWDHSDTTSHYTIIVWQHSDLAHCHVSWEAHEYVRVCSLAQYELCALCVYFALDCTTYGYDSFQTQIYVVLTYDNHTKRCYIRRIFIRRSNIRSCRHIKTSYIHTRTL